MFNPYEGKVTLVLLFKPTHNLKGSIESHASRPIRLPRSCRFPLWFLKNLVFSTPCCRNTSTLHGSNKL